MLPPERERRRKKRKSKKVEKVIWEEVIKKTGYWEKRRHQTMLMVKSTYDQWCRFSERAIA